MRHYKTESVIAPGVIEIGGRRLPTLCQDPTHRMFVIPMENGWNALIVAFPRPDETEYSVATVTRHEADMIGRGHWGLLSTTPNGHRRFEYPRGDSDLLDTLAELACEPSP